MKRKGILWLSLFLLAASVLAGCKASSSTGDADFPNRQLTYMIPFEAGGQSDIEARRQHKHLEKELGQPVVITYKPGGGGSVGWTEMVNKKPDGYYMAGINIPHIILQPMSNEDTGYKTDQIQPVALFQSTPIGLAVKKESGIRSMKDFVQKSKEDPGKVTVAGSGTFSGHHLALQQLEQQAEMKLKYVPFTGAATQVQAFLGGNTDAILANSSDLLKYKDRLNILAIGGEKKLGFFPDTPTFKELGYAMNPTIDRGVGVPKGTPEAVVERLEQAFLQIAKDQKIQQQMKKEGFLPLEMGAKESEQYIEQRKKELEPVLQELK
ncbi:tripartite tricarboxylate transporter substrate binding protein [Melghirimyces thermohalophilus]|uniref:tripartite tricarboxylate transporter substrate binding protein n=1 Tax=Melghirimyces thermohalophilus TaxID=1236220 RepID=UPI001FE03B3D|nr:tripartite tricarboxylate transporter substrate binding protein [Melghirimyces thermohalophilus]